MTPRTPRLLAALFLLSCGSALLGCGPLRSTAFILDAEVQIEAARTAEAEKYAPYEFTLAQLYINKAREVVGFSDYEVGVGFAEQASGKARMAKEKALEAAAKISGTPSFTTTPSDKPQPQQ